MKLLMLIITVCKLINHSLEDHLQMEYNQLFHKEWFTVYGVHFSSTYGLPTFPADSYSHCRVICFTKNCSSLSMVATATGKIDCRIKLTPDWPKIFPQMTFDRIPGAFFYTTEDFSKYQLINGLFYYATKPLLVLLFAVYNPLYCQQNLMDTGIPIVVQSETELNDVMMVLSRAGFALEFAPTNLNYNTLKGWIWSDGTIYSQTELGAKYPLPVPSSSSTSILFPNNFVMFKVAKLFGSISVSTAAVSMGLIGNYTIVCQLNPFNLST